MINPARVSTFISIMLFSLNIVYGQFNLDWKCDSIKKVKEGSITGKKTQGSDSIKNRPPYLHIEGNNYGNIYINTSDSSKTKENIDDTTCLRNKCFYNPKFEFKGYLFGDFVAIDSDRPNGLIQTNAYLSYTRPTTYCRCRKKDRTRILKGDRFFNYSFFRNIVITDFTLSKIGNQIRYLPVRYAQPDSAGLFNRFDLLQYSNVIALTKVNLFTLEYLKNNKIYIDFIPVFYNTPIKDTLASMKSNVYTIAFGGNIKVSAKISNNFTAISLIWYLHQNYILIITVTRHPCN